jgi:hypothetical protein
MSATATEPKKKPPAKLTMHLRDGKQIYSLPKRERDRIEDVMAFCGELEQITDLKLEATEAYAKLGDLLGKFSDE